MSGWRSGMGRWFPWGRPADDANVVDPAVLRRAIDGNPDALELLLEKAIPILRSRIRNALADWGRGNADLENDILQDLQLALLEDDREVLRAFRPERATLRAYLCWWANFRARDKLRDRDYGLPGEKQEKEDSRGGPASIEEWSQDCWDPDRLKSDDLQFYRKVLERFHKDATSELIDLFRRLYRDNETPEAIAKDKGVKVNSIIVQRARILKLISQIREDLLTPVPDSRKGRSKKGGGSR